MEKVKALGDAGKFDEANALLDKILPLLQAEQTSSPAKNKSGPPAASKPATVGMSEITITRAPDHAIFDPSVASDGTGLLHMSLSGVASTTPGGAFTTAGVRTYLATSRNQGKSWKLAGVISPDIGVTLGKAPTNGRWQSEVSALVYDAQAPKRTRWKLIWHQYLNINGGRKFEHGWIAYKEAETPYALAKARPVKLLTGAAYDSVNDNPAGWTRSPIAGAGVNKVHQLASALKGCIVLSEPGLLSKPDALYMSFVCFKPKLLGLLGAYHHVVLLKCTRPCEATRLGAWSYAGTVLTPDDAEDLRLEKFSASDLFSEEGRDYITVSPVSDTPVPGAYKGCVVFRFADLVHGKVARTANGRPSPAKTVSVSADSFNGACTFLPVGANKGLLIGRVDFLRNTKGVDATFHVLRSNVSP